MTRIHISSSNSNTMKFQHLLPLEGQVKSEILQYVIQIIAYLASQQTGTFNSVFYDVKSTESYNNLLGLLLQSPQLNHIVKIPANTTYAETMYCRQSSLIVIHIGNSDDLNWHDNFMSIMRTWDSRIRILLLVDETQWALALIVRFSLYNTNKFFKIVILNMTSKTIHRTEFDGSVKVISHVEPSEVFVDPKRDLKGKRFYYNLLSLSQRAAIVDEELIGPDVRWVKETARFLNATPRLASNPCPTERNSLGFCYQSAFLGQSDIVIGLDRLSRHAVRPHFDRQLYCITPMWSAVLVPNGRQLNLAELFSKPFTWEAWTCLLVVLLAMECLKLLLRGLFENDPILLAICGIEKYNLHRASWFEKLMFFSLIVIFFLMTTGYEAKIIALMTERPSTQIIRTINELIKSSLKVKADLRSFPRVVNSTTIGPLIVNASSSEQMDGVNAYFTGYDAAKLIETLYINYDQEQNRKRYVLLPEPVNMSIVFYTLQFRTKFFEILYWTQRVFFESGLTARWAEEVLKQYRHEYSPKDVLDPSEAAILRFKDITPAWVALAIGLVFCGIVLGLEILSAQKRFPVKILLVRVMAAIRVSCRFKFRKY